MADSFIASNHYQITVYTARHTRFNPLCFGRSLEPGLMPRRSILPKTRLGLNREQGSSHKIVFKKLPWSVKVVHGSYLTPALEFV